MTKIGEDLSYEIAKLIDGDNTFVITDANVDRLYSKLFPNCDKLVLEPGEDNKNLYVIEKICERMLECGANRKTRVIAVGGGVIGDITGFASSIYMRGVDWVSIPTTLLSQVDSGVGGKTGVNLDDKKNIIGTFHSPSEVIISHHFLDTLPKREQLCGIGEIVKTAFLSKELFVYVEKNLQKLLAFDKATIKACVAMCINIKEEIVKKDPKETLGIRKCLNLGHTIGHALEAEDGHRLSHGEYVLWGLLFEAFLTKKFISASFYFYMVGLLKKVLKGMSIEFDSFSVAEAALADKKNENGRISIIAAEDNGKTKELFFSQREIFEGLELCKNEFRL